MQGPLSAERSRSRPPPTATMRRHQNNSTRRHYERRELARLKEAQLRLNELNRELERYKEIELNRKMQSGIAGT